MQRRPPRPAFLAPPSLWVDALEGGQAADGGCARAPPILSLTRRAAAGARGRYRPRRIETVAYSKLRLDSGDALLEAVGHHVIGWTASQCTRWRGSTPLAGGLPIVLVWCNGPSQVVSCNSISCEAYFSSDGL